MKELLEDLIENWRGEVRPAKLMSAVNLAKFNKFFALELDHLWHNSTTVFIEGEEESELFTKRLRLTNGTATIEGSISHREYNQHLMSVRMTDHPVFGPLLIESKSEVVELGDD